MSVLRRLSRVRMFTSTAPEAACSVTTLWLSVPLDDEDIGEKRAVPLPHVRHGQHRWAFERNGRVLERREIAGRRVVVRRARLVCKRCGVAYLSAEQEAGIVAALTGDGQ